MTKAAIRKTSIVSLLVFATAAPSVLASVPVVPAPSSASINTNSGLGIIKGVIRDHSGSPIADATVAIFRVGTSQLLKEVRSGSDGSFLAKIIPGRYTVLAVAEGFNPVTLAAIDVNRSAQLNYGFKLERAGSGNTLPEKRLDRNNPKWVIRAAQTSRSIYQNSEGKTQGVDNVDVTLDSAAEEEPSGAKAQTVVETYFAGTEAGPVSGFNVASAIPITDELNVVVAGQTGIGKKAPLRFETQLNYRPSDLHQLRVGGSFTNLGTLESDGVEKNLSQLSLQATDEWKVREGVILVFGFDYARLVGAGSDFSLSPRLGLQYDLDAKTRFRAAYTAFTEERSWSKAIEFENAQVLFREPASVEDLAVENGKPLLNKSRRMEFGIERVLDNSSSIEANLYFDTTISRGIGMKSLPFDSLDSAGFQEITGNQQGGTQGLRLVYSRRLNGLFSAAAGYSVGVGQKLSEEGLNKPSELFQNDVFQSFFGQFEADLGTGTSLKTVFRLSPQATVFAIDPFQGRLAIYDPSLSVLVTQNLPNLGLPFHAEAMVDARNLFGFSTGVRGHDGVLKLNEQRRGVRGSILVRF